MTDVKKKKTDCRLFLSVIKNVQMFKVNSVHIFEVSRKKKSIDDDVTLGHKSGCLYRLPSLK